MAINVTAQLKYLRISPRKVRLVANLVKGLDAREAQEQLSFLPKHAALPLMKLLQSALANAEHNFNLKRDNLFIRSLIVEGGPVLKRFLPRMGGRVSDIRKRASHVTLVLESRGAEGGRKPKAKKTSPPLSSGTIVAPADGISSEPENVSPSVQEGVESDVKTRKEKFRAPKREEVFRKTPRFVKRIFRRKSV